MYYTVQVILNRMERNTRDRNKKHFILYVTLIEKRMYTINLLAVGLQNPQWINLKKI